MGRVLEFWRFGGVKRIIVVKCGRKGIGIIFWEITMEEFGEKDEVMR